MLKKTVDRILRKLGNKQLYFIDSSILVEIILKQDYAEECRRFLNSTKSSNKVCAVSNSVMGEVLCTLLFNELGLDRNSLLLAFEAMLEMAENFVFVTIGLETIEEERRIREEEGFWLQQMDLLNLASAVRHKAAAFVTLDPDFSNQTGKKFGVKIINPKEPNMS